MTFAHLYHQNRLRLNAEGRARGTQTRLIGTLHTSVRGCAIHTLVTFGVFHGRGEDGLGSITGRVCAIDIDDSARRSPVLTVQAGSRP